MVDVSGKAETPREAVARAVLKMKPATLRAVRRGKRISVSGTTATHGSRLIGGSDPAAQAHFAIDKIEGALESLGGKLSDVVRTRIFVKDRSQWEPVARAHGERFASIQPANTLVEARLIGDEYLVEIEADAELP